MEACVIDKWESAAPGVRLRLGAGGAEMKWARERGTDARPKTPPGP